MIELDSIRLPDERFITQSAGESWVVIEQDTGRPVSDLTDHASACILAEDLNVRAWANLNLVHAALNTHYDFPYLGVSE